MVPWTLLTQLLSIWTKGSLSFVTYIKFTTFFLFFTRSIKKEANQFFFFHFFLSSQSQIFMGSRYPSSFLFILEYCCNAPFFKSTQICGRGSCRVPNRNDHRYREKILPGGQAPSTLSVSVLPAFHPNKTDVNVMKTRAFTCVFLFFCSEIYPDVDISEITFAYDISKLQYVEFLK